jgi:hypothetical protein
MQQTVGADSESRQREQTPPVIYSHSNCSGLAITIQRESGSNHLIVVHHCEASVRVHQECIVDARVCYIVTDGREEEGEHIEGAKHLKHINT